MKSVTIPTGVATAWSGTFRSFVDGDIFRESNIDLNAGDIAERLAYLKDKADVAAYLASDQTFTGSNTFACGASETFVVTGTAAAQLPDVEVNGDLTVTGTMITSGLMVFNSGFGVQATDLGDADSTMDTVNTINRVPTLTANRIYTLPTTAIPDGYLVYVVRTRTADAYTVTVKDSSLSTYGVISASAAGWLLLQRRVTGVSNWRLIAWGGTVTSLDTNA